MANDVPQKGEPLVFFDVESLPVDRDDPLWLKLRSRVEVLPEESEEDHEARMEKIYQFTTMNPALGRVWMVGYAIGKAGPVLLVGDGTLEGERQVLETFQEDMSRLDNPWWIGHNIIGFDIPFMQVRALKHGFTGLARQLGRATAKPWNHRYLDTMKLWPRTSNDRSGWKDGLRGLAKLEVICQVLGIELQTGVMGKDVAAAFAEGDTEGAKEHLRLDIVQLRELFKRLWPIL